MFVIRYLLLYIGLLMQQGKCWALPRLQDFEACLQQCCRHCSCCSGILCFAIHTESSSFVTTSTSFQGKASCDSRVRNTSLCRSQKYSSSTVQKQQMLTYTVDCHIIIICAPAWLWAKRRASSRFRVFNHSNLQLASHLAVQPMQAVVTCSKPTRWISEDRQGSC